MKLPRFTGKPKEAALSFAMASKLSKRLSLFSPPVARPPLISAGLSYSPLGTFLEGLREEFLVLGGLFLVALIALLDYGTGPDFSLNIFYLIPVAACAWWGGFSPGLLLALAGAVTWQGVEALENPAIPPVIGLWNGVVRFGTLVLVSSLVSRVRVGILRERRLARTDPLTGAANGRTFYEVAAINVERALRTSQPLTLAYLDLDNFKLLNDRLGHAAGDAALLDVVRTVLANLRATDLLARLGGDEFALLLPDTAVEGTANLLTRLQELVSQEMVKKGWPVTLSIGAITFFRPRRDLDRMIQEVDALMYQAKRKGKGRVEHAVVEDSKESQFLEGPEGEKRATVRLLCHCPARVRPEGENELEEFATVRDISTEGVGLLLNRPLPVDAVLTVEPLSPLVKTLLARVVHTTLDGTKWIHGCKVAPQLSAEELKDWVGGSVPRSHR